MRLLLATEAQRRERDLVTASAWGQGLTVDQFLARERRLRAHPWAARALRSWWWVDAGGVLLSSCETFDAAATCDGAPGVAHVIASVFTEPRFRGGGHASAMLRKVLEVAPGPDSQAFVLFSEVGVPLYARLGFSPVPSFDVCAPAKAGVVRPDAGGWPQVSPALGALALVRDAGFLDWQWERERTYAELLRRAPPPTHSSACEGFTIGWTAYFKTNELQVLWLDPAPPEIRRELLAAAQACAAATGLELVRVWDDADGAWARGVEGARIMTRDDEVPMYRSLRAGCVAWRPIERATWA